MPSTIDLLSLIEEYKIMNIRQLARKLEIPLRDLKEILMDLLEYKLVDYEEETGKVKLASWLNSINKEINELKPSTGTIILPRYQEIMIQDVAVGNFTRNDLELKVRLKAGSKEIAICNLA